MRDVIVLKRDGMSFAVEITRLLEDNAETIRKVVSVSQSVTGDHNIVIGQSDAPREWKKVGDCHDMPTVTLFAQDNAGLKSTHTAVARSSD